MKEIFVIVITLSTNFTLFAQSDEYGSSEYWSSNGVKIKKIKPPESEKKPLLETPLIDTNKLSNPSEKSNREIIEGMFENGKYKEFSKVVECPNKSKSEIYTALKLWYGKTFNSAKEVIQSDVPGEIIVGVGNSSVAGSTYWYEITTLIKDGKFKTTIGCRKILVSNILLPSLETYYLEWKEKKIGFFTKTGSMSNKELIMVDIVHKTNEGIVKGMTNEVESYNSF
jgi:hypothetical protein